MLKSAFELVIECGIVNISTKHPPQTQELWPWGIANPFPFHIHLSGYKLQEDLEDFSLIRSLSPFN